MEGGWIGYVDSYLTALIVELLQGGVSPSTRCVAAWLWRAGKAA